MAVYIVIIAADLDAIEYLRKYSVRKDSFYHEKICELL